MRKALLLSASILAIGAMGSAGAQEAPARGASGPASEAAEAQLADIVVTAQRKEESLQSAPVAVAVVGGDDLVRAGITAPGRLQELVPALAIEPTSSGNLIFIRGVGNFALTANSDPATAFNYDEVYVGRPSSSNGVFYDLQRVEVLKGPQGTLYGRNATAGAINVIPVQPQLGEWGGYFVGSYGNYDAITAEGAINLPLGDNGAMRISGNLSKRDGYLKDGTSDDDTKGLRVQLKAELTPTLTVRTSFDYSRVSGNGEGVTYLNRFVFDRATNSFVVTPSGLDLDEGSRSPASQAFRQTIAFTSIGARANPISVQPGLDNQFFGANVNIAWDTGIGTLTVIPAWRYANIDSIAGAAFVARSREKDDQHSLELRFASSRFSIFDLTAGAYYYDEKIRGRGVIALESANNYTTSRYDTLSKAVYGRLTAHLSDRLRVTGGIRYTHDRKTTDSSGIALAVRCTVMVAGVPSCPNAPLLTYTQSLEEQPRVPAPGGSIPLGAGAVLTRTDTINQLTIRRGEITYRGAVEFDLGARSLLFASVETGYRSGGFNIAQGRGPYDPEYITAYTVGSKNRFFDNRVQLNLEGFLWKYRDQQLSYIGLDSTLRPANITDNIGRSTIKGIEGELKVLATPSTLLNANVQYLDSKYDSFRYQQPVAAGRPNTSCPVTVNATNATLFDVDCSGFPTFNAPKWTMNFGAQQTVELGDYEFVLAADTQYRSSRYIYFQYQPSQFVSGDWRSNAQISFGPKDDRWSIAAYVRNIENNRTLVFAPQHPSLPTVTAQVTAPRTYGVRFGVKF